MTTQSQHAIPSPILTGEVPISTPRAGFDRLVFSSSQRFDAGWLAPSDFSNVLVPMGYRPSRLRFTQPDKRSMYARSIPYQHATDADAPLLDLRYRPNPSLFRVVPAFQLWFRASGLDLLDVDAVDRIVRSLSSTFGQFKLAEVELTFDLPGGTETTLELQRECYPVRSRQSEGRPDGIYQCWGRGISATRFRVYHKPELGVARFESNLRTAALKRYGIHNLDNLRNADWCALAKKFVRFLDFVPNRNRPVCFLDSFEAAVGLYGVKAALAYFPEDRTWLRRRLRPTDNQVIFEGCLNALSESLRAKPAVQTEEWAPS